LSPSPGKPVSSPSSGASRCRHVFGVQEHPALREPRRWLLAAPSKQRKKKRGSESRRRRFAREVNCSFRSRSLHKEKLRDRRFRSSRAFHVQLGTRILSKKTSITTLFAFSLVTRREKARKREMGWFSRGGGGDEASSSSSSSSSTSSSPASTDPSASRKAEAAAVALQAALESAVDAATTCQAPRSASAASCPGSHPA